MKWFRAQKATGSDKVDFEKGIIYGVSINTEGEAKGHGVNLDKEFVEDVTRLGNEKKHGVKARFGHPNMSSTAMGTFIGRYHNFHTVYRNDKAISKADLHLSETAKTSPNGNLFEYVLNLADKEPDMFGTSIVFSQKPGYYYYDDEGKKVHTKYSSDVPRDKKRYVGIAQLHANDVVDEPAANPEGLFSQFSKDLTAAKLTEFLDENPEVFDLYANEEIRDSFMQRYESYKQEKEVGTMPKDKKKSFKEKFYAFFEAFFSEEENEGTSEKPETKEDTEETEEDAEEVESTEETAEETESTEEAEETEEESTEETAEESEEYSARISDLETQLSERDEKITSLKTQLKDANSKLKALGSGLDEGGEDAPNLRKFDSWEDAINFQMDEQGMNSDEAFAFCEKHYIDLYPKSE